MSDPSTNHETRPSPAAGPSAPQRPRPSPDRGRSLRLPDRPAAPAGRTAWAPWILCGLLAAAVVFLLVRDQPPAKTEEAKSPPPVDRPDPAKPLAPGEVVLESKGYIQATRLYKVGPNQVGGKVVSLHKDFQEGRRVEENTVLVQLDATEYEARCKQAEGEYEQARGDLEKAKHRLEELKRNTPREIEQAAADLRMEEAVLVQRERDYVRATGIGAASREEKDKKEADFQTQRAL